MIFSGPFLVAPGGNNSLNTLHHPCIICRGDVIIVNLKSIPGVQGQMCVSSRNT